MSFSAVLKREDLKEGPMEGEPQTKSQRRRGKKFGEKYNVGTSQGYQCDPDNPKLRVPPPGHALYDQDGNDAFDARTVEEIDRDGAFVGDVIVWTDVDADVLWIVDGRGNWHNVREVNRRRRARGDETINIHVKPLDVPLERAAEHVRLRNFHRKRITIGHVAREIVELRRLGKDWERIAGILRLGPECDEAWQRSVAPLAHAIPEVAAAAEAGKIKRSKYARFGGRDIFGAKRLPEAEQRALLAEMLAPKRAATEAAPRFPPAARRRLREALSNGAVAKIRDPGDRVAAEVAARVLAWEAGDRTALSEWPELASIFEEAIESPTSSDD